MSLTPPPIGIKPRFVHEEERLKELTDAIARYVAADAGISSQWIAEFNELYVKVVERNYKLGMCL